MEFHVRWANALDIDFLQCGVTNLLSELRGCTVEMEKEELNKTITRMISDNENYGIFIANHGEKRIGLMAFSVTEAMHCGKYAVIEELWVLKDYRSAGAGKLLIEGLERYCAEHGIKRIDVGLPGTSFQDFDKTNGFYSKCGFTDVGPRKKKVIE